MAKTNAAKMYTSTLNNAMNATPQSRPIVGRENEMVKNNAGGVVFELNKWDTFDRFLIMGTEGGSYYCSSNKITLDACVNTINCITEDGIRAVKRIVEISDAGRAIKNDSAIFALALAAASENREVAKYAFASLGEVCRIGTHLFAFMEAYNTFGKWRNYAKAGVANWYKRPPEKLAIQLLKYQQRNGWSHRDVLRLAHVKPENDVQNAMFYWASNDKKRKDDSQLPQIFDVVENLHKTDAKDLVKSTIRAIQDFNLTWEMLPTEVLKNAEVWEALAPKMGMTALIRNLGRMSAIGATKPLSANEKVIISRLTDAESLKKGRIHPITILSAMKTYSGGHGDKGSLQWNVSPKIVDALNDAFYASFGQITPSGENYFLAIDCSGSMFGANVNGINNLTAAEAAAVMALATAKVERNYFIGGFDTSISELKITPNMRLDQVLKVMRKFNWGGTDCAQPMIYAQANKMEIDKFCVYTDNETWAGRVHPSQALKKYRSSYGKGKLIVAGTSTTNFSIADPKDAGMLDIVGFDSSAPQIISQF